jgi:aminoglycoside 6'-N-acetyltransferase
MSDSAIGRLTRVGEHELLLRALQPDDAADLLRIHATPEVVRWWGEPEQGFPFSDEPEQTRLSILVDGAVAGMLQYWEESTPRYRHATIDLFLDPPLHGQGIGTQALWLLSEHLLDEHTHHRLTIDPAVENAAAIRSYEKAGFRGVGLMRAYEHRGAGDYRDALLMEKVKESAN